MNVKLGKRKRLPKVYTLEELLILQQWKEKKKSQTMNLKTWIEELIELDGELLRRLYGR